MELISLAPYISTSHGCKHHPSSNEQETLNNSDPPSFTNVRNRSYRRALIFSVAASPLFPLSTLASLLPFCFLSFLHFSLNSLLFVQLEYLLFASFESALLLTRDTSRFCPYSSDTSQQQTYSFSHIQKSLYYSIAHLAGDIFNSILFRTLK